jgi:uncharacterized protein (TIGR01244 family)
MKNTVMLFCCLALAVGVACSSETAQEISDNPSVDTVIISVDQIEKNPGTLPSDGFVASGQPNEAVLKSFADAGYGTIVDLRMPDEDRGLDEKTVIEGLGMTYVTLPIGSAEDLSFENAAKLDAIMSGLEQPAVLHCGSGNRVGALIALRAKANGASDEDALAAGKAAGMTRLEDVVRKKLGME